MLLDFDSAMEMYRVHIKEDYIPTEDHPFTVTFEPGKTYIRVVTEQHYGQGQRSCHSFIVMENTALKNFKRGDILKAAGWKAPAKNYVRGNIFNQGSYKSRVKWTGVI